MSRAPFAVLLAALLAGCSPGDAPPPGGADSLAAADPVPPPAPDPETEALRRWGGRLPPGLLTRSGVCPFECCTYGDWLAQSEISVVSEPRSAAAAPVGRIPAGERFRADSGRVYVTGLAVVAVTDTVEGAPTVRLVPGDTLVVLDYTGEGYFDVWRGGEARGGEVLEVQGFWQGEQGSPRGRMLGRHATEWWVHVTLPRGRGGWFFADAPEVDFHGADACGGPAPA